MPMTKAAKEPYVPAEMPMREKMALAIYEGLQARSFSILHPWATRPVEYRESFMVAADAALDAQQDALSPTEGCGKEAVDYLLKAAPHWKQPLAVTITIIEAFLRAAKEGK